MPIRVNRCGFPVMDDGVAERIRLWGLDCPESKQPFGTRAKHFTADMASGETVTVHVRGVDRYKRALAEIILPNGQNLKQELLRAGFAWWYQQFARHEKVLADLEDEARSAKRGLWGGPQRKSALGVAKTGRGCSGKQID